MVSARPALGLMPAHDRQLITLPQRGHRAHPLIPLTLTLLACLLQAAVGAGALAGALETILQAAQLGQALIRAAALQLAASLEVIA